MENISTHKSGNVTDLASMLAALSWTWTCKGKMVTQIFQNFSKKTNRKIQKRNSILFGNAQAICEMQKSKKAIELVEVYVVPRKFNEDSSTCMNGKGRLCKNVGDFSNYFQKKKITKVQREFHILYSGYAFKQLLDS